MTGEEALKGLIKERDLEKANRDIWDEEEDRIRSDRYVEMLNIAIKALEQEPILDKIRVEIEEKARPNEIGGRGNGKSIRYGLCMALQIIDKYKAESEGE